MPSVSVFSSLPVRFFLHLRTDTQIRIPVSTIAPQDIRPDAMLSVEIVSDDGLGVEVSGNGASVEPVNHRNHGMYSYSVLFIYLMIHLTPLNSHFNAPSNALFRCVKWQCV